MKPLAVNFKPRGGISMKKQIVEGLREAILKGEIPEGTKLESTSDLAERWNTHVPTVHAALSVLAKEGLVRRSMHYGTTVTGMQRKLDCVGTYFDEGSLSDNGNYTGRLLQTVGKQLERRGIRTQTWIDHRLPADTSQPWAELKAAAERRDIQGLIVLAANPTELPWLQKLPVPVAIHSSAVVENRVFNRISEAFPAAMAALASQGCRSVGLITVLPRENATPGCMKTESMLFHDGFDAAAAASGLETREQWIYSPKSMRNEKGAESFGYECFNAFWKQPDRPDALLVFTDLAAKGALAAIFQQHVNVPEELKLVLHRNAELGLFCPVPATFVDVSIHEVAQALVEMVESLSRGDTALQSQMIPHVVSDEALVDMTSRNVRLAVL